MKFSTLAERQILKARAEGQLDGLEGEGKPLEHRDGDAGLGVGMRMMADQGVLPREFELGQAVDAQRKVLAVASDRSRKAEMTKLADLEMHLAIEQEARRRFFRD